MKKFNGTHIRIIIVVMIAILLMLYWYIFGVI